MTNRVKFLLYLGIGLTNLVKMTLLISFNHGVCHHNCIISMLEYRIKIMMDKKIQISFEYCGLSCSKSSQNAYISLSLHGVFNIEDSNVIYNLKSINQLRKLFCFA